MKSTLFFYLLCMNALTFCRVTRYFVADNFSMQTDETLYGTLLDIEAVKIVSRVITC